MPILMPLFLIAAQAAPSMIVAPQPPVIMAAPSRSVQGPPVTVDVEVRAGGETLWSGQMRVSTRSGASFSRQQTNADVDACQPTPGYYESGTRTSLTINMSMVRRDPASDALDVRVNWERPSETDRCDTRRGTRTVALNETVLIRPGEAVTMNADGGLTIRLRRR